MNHIPRNPFPRWIIVFLIAAFSCGCESAPKGSDTPAVTLLVTASLETPAAALVEAFNKNLPPDGQIAVRTVTEGELSGNLAIGDASAVLQWQEPHAEDWSARLGWTGISLVVHPENPLQGISSAEARGIFSGRMERWEDVGGSPGGIHPFVVDPGDPMAGLFEHVVLSEGRLAAGAMIVPSLDGMPAAIVRDAQSIGYLMMFDPATGVKILAVDSIKPDYPELLTGAYPFRIPIFLRAQEPVAAEILAFAGWAQSVSGQAVLLQLHSRES
jgi:ABC-type phosphate transport system substrate-binding protein